MNQKKFCFIICVNNERYMEECIYYISRLKVPEGYEIDVLTIEGAESMTAGYNEGMRESDAKYKIYLHQDVFIVNRDFLSDILNIFEDSSIGMAGVVGSPRFPKNAIMWYGDRVGRIYTTDGAEAGISVMSGDGVWEVRDTEELCEVEVIDGLLMATQYDISWREDLFKGWDFYDISQSFEFRKQGYRVVVPAMEQPWCIHDDGYSNLSNYFDEREIFLKEYGKWRDDNV